MTMNYLLLCLTQLLTVAAILVAARWAKDYLERVNEGQRLIIEESFLRMQVTQDAASASIREVVASSNEQVTRVIDQSFRDREILCERIQFPEHMRAQAPAVNAGPKSQSHTMDEEAEFQLDHPDADPQPVSVGEMIPGARREDDEIRPVPTVQPFGKGRSNGSTE